MRSFGRFDRRGDGSEINVEALYRDTAKSGVIRRIGGSRAWALVRADLPDLLWCEQGDGSFAIIDGELFDTAADRQTGPAERNEAAVILERFRAEGISVFATLNGSAAVMLWDAASGRLALARDRSGLGLCFWMESPSAVTFGSDILSLVRCDSRSKLDAAAVDFFLASGFIPAPWTSLDHIRTIPPAHVAVIDDSLAQLSRYWRPTGQPQLRLGLQARKQQHEAAILKGIERQLPGRASSAVLLSGGIDSMYLTALLARQFGVRPITFTYRYADYEGEFNEGARARATARLLGLEHHEMLVRPTDIASSLRSMLVAHSGPLSYGAHSAILGDVARSGAQVLYNGLESDAPYCSPSEMLGQLLRHLPLPHAAIAQHIEHVVGKNARWARSLAYAERVAATGLVWRFHAPLTPDPLRKSLYLDPDRFDQGRRAAASLFGDVLAEFANESAMVRVVGPLGRLYSEGSTRWSSCFAREHGLSARSPFLDNDYLDLLHRMPWSAGKREIRELAAKYLPRDLAFAPKIAQTLPIAHWLRTPASDFVTGELHEARIVAGRQFRYEVIEALINRHRSGAGSHAWTLWNVLMITLWQEIVGREAGRYLTRAFRPLDTSFAQVSASAGGEMFDRIGSGGWEAKQTVGGPRISSPDDARDA